MECSISLNETKYIYQFTDSTLKKIHSNVACTCMILLHVVFICIILMQSTARLLIFVFQLETIQKQLDNLGWKHPHTRNKRKE